MLLFHWSEEEPLTRSAGSGLLLEISLSSLTLLFTGELRILLRSYAPMCCGFDGFCPIAEGDLIGKTRYVRSLKGCEQ